MSKGKVKFLINQKVSGSSGNNFDFIALMALYFLKIINPHVYVCNTSELHLTFST